jgi:hypothetical protein
MAGYESADRINEADMPLAMDYSIRHAGHTDSGCRRHTDDDWRLRSPIGMNAAMASARRGSVLSMASFNLSAHEISIRATCKMGPQVPRARYVRDRSPRIAMVLQELAKRCLRCRVPNRARLYLVMARGRAIGSGAGIDHSLLNEISCPARHRRESNFTGGAAFDRDMRNEQGEYFNAPAQKRTLAHGTERSASPVHFFAQSMRR